MNAYLSRDEKEQLVRLLALNHHLNIMVQSYATKVKNVDKDFLKYLRMTEAFLRKALGVRAGYLDKVTQENLESSFRKLHVIFVPTDQARKEYTELCKLQTAFPFDINDFNDWYGFVLEHSCKTCARADYEACEARRILTKYDVYPYNPGAVGACQFSYMSTSAEPEPVPQLEKTEPPVENLTISLADYLTAKGQKHVKKAMRQMAK